MKDLIGTVIDGQYRIDEVIGTGAMGVVYRATQLSLQREVAIKVLRSDAATAPVTMARFTREAVAIARLKNPHIVTIYDFGVAEGIGAYIVMELLEGHTLRTELEYGGRVSAPRIGRVMRQTCNAVSAAHGAGVIHRDLKPDNIHVFETPDGPVVKVLDFGIAKLQGASDANREAITVDGTVVGTPAYMSPEQCEGEPLDARSDVYSLGCVAFELFAGRPPFVAKTSAMLMIKHVTEAPPSLRSLVPEAPEELESVLNRSLARDAEDRFQTADDFGRAVEAIASSMPGAYTLGDDVRALFDVAPTEQAPALGGEPPDAIGDARRDGGRTDASYYDTTVEAPKASADVGTGDDTSD